MFIARSVRRLRFARFAFLLAGVLPCACLAAWAAHLRSAGHREALRVRWQQVVGLPLDVASVEHPRPGVVRLHGCRLAAEGGSERLLVPVVEIEDAPGEVRLRLRRLDLDADAAAVAAGMAAEWLARESRFPRNCVVDVEDLHWSVTGWSGRGHASAAGRLRIECVAIDGSRAIRCTLAARDERPSEVRVVRSTQPGDGGGTLRHDVLFECRAPVPLAIVSRLLSAASLPALALGEAAGLTATGTARDDGGRWQGGLTARVEGVDLQTAAAQAGGRAAGVADVLVRRLDWDEGRITAAEIEVSAASGQVGQAWLETLVRASGCRYGSGFAALPPGADVRYDAAGALLRIDGRGLEILAPTGLRGVLAVVDGRPLVEPPASGVPLGRVGDWLAPRSDEPGPSRRAGRLRDLLPREFQAVRPAPQREF